MNEINSEESKAMVAAFNNNARPLEGYEDFDEGWFFENFTLTFNVVHNSCLLNGTNLNLALEEFKYFLKLAESPELIFSHEQLKSEYYSEDASRKLKEKIIKKFRKVAKDNSFPFKETFEVIKNHKGIGNQINIHPSNIKIIKANNV